MTDLPAQPAARPRGPDAGPSERAVSWQFSIEHVGLVGALLVLCLVLTAVAPHFLTVRNLVNVLQSISFLGIVALGMTFVILAGEIDISVGSAMALYSALLGVLPFYRGWPLWGAVVLVLVLGAAIGGLAGYLRDRFSIPSFIVTLALLSALRGAALFMTDASPIAVDGDAFAFWGGGRILGAPVPVIIFVVLFALFWFLAEKTTFGRSVYAVGGNPDAARISGISLRKVRVLIFAGTGLLSSISAILLSSLIGSGNAGLGQGAEFQVIAAVIVGGTSLFGGRGSMTGTLLGVLFVGILSNGMVLMGANQYLQQIAQGVIILVAVLLSESMRGGGLAAGLARLASRHTRSQGS
jgi:ribose/xylose/arabinose/galactoside ABC-type transport system permease subunit